MRHKILVVEDDHALRDVLLRGLRDEDFDPVSAPDGASACGWPPVTSPRPSWTSGCPTRTGGTWAR